MPVTQRTEAEVEQLCSTMRPKLVFALEERKIPRDVIAQFASLDIVTVNQFARTARSDDDFVQWLEEDVKANKADPGGRSLQARLFDAYDFCKKIKDEEDAVSAKSKALGQAAEAPRGDLAELRQTYQGLVGKIRDEVYPSYAYFNNRLQELEENELVAETLDAVTSRRLELQLGTDDYSIQWNRRGEAMMKRSKLRGQLPKTTEEYRTIYTIMGHHWSLVRLRHGSRPFLQGLDAAFWGQHVEHMLGEDVRGLCAKSPSGVTLAAISWHTFIVYDQELRNHAFKLVNEEGATIKDAMAKARHDNELRTKYLVTPLALNHLEGAPSGSGGNRTRADVDWNDNSTGTEGGRASKRARKKQEKASGGKGAKGGDKSKGKGKGKKGERSRLQQLRTAGRLKFGAEGSCWEFNKPSGCAKGDACPFAHTCANCGGRHSVEDCDSFAAAMAR